MLKRKGAHSSEFKFKVALEATKGQLTIVGALILLIFEYVVVMCI